MALRSRFPDYVEAVTTPLGGVVARTGVTPNVLTTLGIVLTAVAAGLVGAGELVIGGWVLIAGGLMDTLDGAVARATGRSTPFGGFYDSVSDRVSDGLIFAGLGWALRADPRLFVLVLVALVSSSVTSYVRAKAEGIDLECSVGILERAERAILLIIALVFHRWFLEPVLWLLAVGGVFTVIQRVHHVWCQIDRDIPYELVALTMYDRAWSRAFKAAARRFYGERNFSDALDNHHLGPEQLSRGDGEGSRHTADRPRRDEDGDGDGLRHAASDPRRDGAGDGLRHAANDPRRDGDGVRRVGRTLRPGVKDQAMHRSKRDEPGRGA